MPQSTRGVGRKREKLEAANMPTTNHLLVIGIDSYSEGIPTLNNAVKDAKAFEDLLNKKYDFKNEHIISLYDKEATTDNILDVFDTLIKKLTLDDNLIFYFSGHGELIKTTNQGYWVPVEARANRRGDYLINTEIKNFVAACKARHILGIIDACYSGSLLRKINNPLLQKYFTKPSRRVMTSGLIEPVPDGLPNNHSPFAAALLNSLKYNTKPYLSTSALWQDMQEGLASNSFASAQYETMHAVGHQGGDFFFLATEFDDIPEVEVKTPSSTKGATKGINTPVAATTQETSTSLSPGEIKGLKRQLELSIKVLNKLRETVALETDPSLSVKYEVQIEEKEKAIQQIKEQLQTVPKPKIVEKKVPDEVKHEDDVDLSSLPLQEWQTALKRLAVTDIKRALTKAEDRIDTSSDAFNSLLLLQSRYHSAKKNKDSGLVTDQQSNISFNRIKAAFTGFLEDLEDYDLK